MVRLKICEETEGKLGGNEFMIGSAPQRHPLPFKKRRMRFASDWMVGSGKYKKHSRYEIAPANTIIPRYAFGASILRSVGSRHSNTASTIISAALRINGGVAALIKSRELLLKI